MLGAAQSRAQDAGDDGSRGEWRARVAAGQRAYDDFATQARVDAATRAAARAAREPLFHGAIEDFIGDDTLQRGDVVVTDKGFRVFGGANGAVAPRHFAPLGEATKQRTGAALRELEKASGPIPRD